MPKQNTRRRVASVLAGAVTAATFALVPTSSFAAPAPSVNAVTQADNSFRFSWEASEGASAYRLEIATDPNFSQILEAVNTYSRVYTARNDLANTDGRQLYWRVAAYSTGVSATTLGPWTAGDAFNVDALTPPAATYPADGFVANYPAPVKFKWGGVRKAVSYDVQYAPNGDFTAANAVTVSTTGRGFAPEAPLSPGEWQWRVRAKTYPAAGNAYSSWSPARAFTVAWPEAASQVSAASLAPSTDQAISDLKFSWNPVAGASTYRLLVSRDQDMTNPIVNASLPGTTFVPNIPVQPGNYYWTVTARDISGNLGTPTTPVRFNKLVDDAPVVTTAHSTNPDTATEVPIDQLNFSWAPVARATLYRVEIRTVGTSRGDVVCRTASTSIAPPTYYLTNTSAGTYLKGGAACTGLTTGHVADWLDGKLVAYTVRAVNYAGNSATSIQANDPAGIVRSDASVERFVRVTSATGGENNPNNIVNQDVAFWDAQLDADGATSEPAPVMRWAPLLGAGGYEVSIFRGTNTTNPVATYRTYGTTFRPNGVFTPDTTGVSYSWRVRAFTGSHTSPNVTYLSPLGVDSQQVLQWTRKVSSTVVPSNYLTNVNNTPLISWTPQAETALSEGGNRGYQVNYRLAGDVAWITEDVEYPFWQPSRIVLRNVNGLPETTVYPLVDGNYEFRVAALDANGDPGSFSEVKGFNVAHSVPASLTVSRDGATYDVAWAPAAGAKGYQIRYRHGSAPWATVPGASATQGQTTDVLDMLPTPDFAGEWEFQVRARGVDTGNPIVWSAWSPTTTLTVNSANVDQTTPDAAILSTADRTLRWDPVPGASRYMVQMNTASATVASAAPVEVVGTSYTPETALVPATTYYWRVTAITELETTSKTLAGRVGLGTSPVRTFFVVTPPKVTTMKAATPVSASEVAVTWTPLAGANAGANDGAAYVVRYRPNGVTPPAEWTSTAQTTLNAEALTVGGLASGVEYEFQVQAVNSEGTGPWSASKVAKPFGVASPPTNLLAKAASTSSLAVTWSAPQDLGGSAVTGYIVRWGLPGQGMSSTQVGKVASYTITGLAAGTAYNVEVQAITGAGFGNVAAAQGTTTANPVTPPTTPPTTPTTPPTTPTTPPTDPTPTKAVPGMVTVKLAAKPGKTIVSWTAAKSAKPITKYTVQYSANGKKWKTVKTLPGSAKKLTSKLGKKGKYVYFRVAATNADGMGKYSLTKKIKRK